MRIETPDLVSRSGRSHAAGVREADSGCLRAESKFRVLRSAAESRKTEEKIGLRFESRSGRSHAAGVPEAERRGVEGIQKVTARYRSESANMLES